MIHPLSFIDRKSKQRNYLATACLGIFIAFILSLSFAVPNTAHAQSCGPAPRIPSFNPADYDRVIDGQTFTSMLSIDGEDNVLITNSTFRGMDSAGIQIRNASNITIINSRFENINGTGIRLRSSGSTDGVYIGNNTFNNLHDNGISSAQRSSAGVDHTNTVIQNNRISNTGYIANQRAHGIYVQGSGSQVLGNRITGHNDANGISIRSSGVVSGNYIDVTTTDNFGAGIKYYSDHRTGPSRTLTISNNVIVPNNMRYGISLDETSNNRGSTPREQWVVNNFNLISNDVSGFPSGNQYNFNLPSFTTVNQDNGTCSTLPVGGGPVAPFVPQISDTQGQDILTDLLQTQNFDEAVEELASVSDLSISEAEELLSSIIEIPDLDLSSGGQLLDGFIEGRLDVSELGTIVNTLDGIQDTLNNPEILNTLIGNIGSGIIPPGLAEAISLVDELGELGSIDDFADILATPEIAEEIREIFNNSIFSNPLAALEAVSALAEIFVNSAEFIGQSIDEITAQVLGALEGAIPDVFQGLLQLVGGDRAALIAELGAQLIGNFDLGGFDIAPGETGEYEIFDREPHSSPVSQSCRTSCALPCTCEPVIQQNHINIRAHKTDEFIRHRTWMVDVFFREHIHYAMKLMTVQLSAVAMRQVFIIGKMFDAKHQQETQRLFQQLMAEAHRDYYPSEGLCEIGTNTRALAGSEDKTNIAQLAFANRMQDRAQRSADSLSGADENADRVSRILRFQEIYCNRGDNANGLSWLCAPTDTPRDRRNKDINFSQTVLSELTLEADYLNNDPADDPDGEDVFALTTNLFSDELMPNMERVRLATPQGLPRYEAMKYMDLRSILAKRSVAENAFASIVAERVSGMDAVDYSFMRRILVDLGVPEDEINEFLGEYPSYYAQRKVLTDYVFENPIFYTELYESHANVLRKDTAIKALNLMLEDDMFDRQLESEAVLAVILETMLEEEHTRIGRQITDLEPGDY